MINLKPTVAFVFLFVHGCISELCAIDGAQKVNNGTVHLCANASWIPNGCVTSSGELLNFGKLVKTADYVFQCQKSSDTLSKMVAIACMVNGTNVAPSETIFNGISLYKCSQENDTLKLRLSPGCQTPDGRLVLLEDDVKIGDFLYRCNISDGVSRLEPAGCVRGNNTYNIDEIGADDKVWFTCEQSENGKLSLTIDGCVNDAVLIRPNERFRTHGFIYECKKENDVVRSVGVGCLQRTHSNITVEHKIGGRWLEGDGTVRFVVECGQNNDEMYKDPVQCAYVDKSGETTALNGGCMTKVGEVLVLCRKGDNQVLRATLVENPKKETVEQKFKEGFSVCNDIARIPLFKRII